MLGPFREAGSPSAPGLALCGRQRQVILRGTQSGPQLVRARSGLGTGRGRRSEEQASLCWAGAGVQC